MTWGSALRAASLGISGSLLFLAIVGAIVGVGIDPFIVVIGLVFAFGAIWQARLRGGATAVTVLSVLWFLMSIGLGGYKALARPASWPEFVVVVASAVFPIVAVIAYRGARRTGFDAAANARLLPVSFGVIGLALVVGLAATFAAASDTAQAGDLQVKATAFKWAPESLSAKAGRIGILVENEDPSHHDFTITGVVELQIPSFHARRATFVVQPGTYRYVCTLHPTEMRGTLTVR